MAKRGNNIYKRKDGRYEGRVPIGYHENGKIRYKSVYAHTLAEVKQKMSEIYSVSQDDKQSSAVKVTFRDVAQQWLLSAKLRVKPSSYANYQNIIRNHLLPELGGMYMTNLTTAKINDFILKKLNNGRLNGKGGLSAKSVRDIMTVFRSISSYAAREYNIREVYFTMPKTEQKKIDVLSISERNRLVYYLKENLNRINIAILLCLFTGLRVGELCGLQWKDIDLENNVLSISRTVQRINLSGKSKVIVGTPKSKSSVRSIPIPEFMRVILTEIKKNDSTYFITGTEKPTEPRTMQNRFHKILKECGLRCINFHILRHTYATICIEHGFDPKTLSELLGHADASITLNRYVHSSMQLKQDYVSRLQMTA